MSSNDTKGDTRNKYSKKTVENGKMEGGNNKVKDSKSHGNNEVSSTAGSDLEMDSRILSALLTVCIHSAYHFICLIYTLYLMSQLCSYIWLCLFLLKLVLDLWLHFLYSSFHHMQGVNRALPYVASSEVDDIVDVQTPILFRLVSFCR